jgi:pyrroloquinoline quinone (PQQ) biosynthesis protein C
MLLKGQWNVFYYKSFLREVYHYSKEDPQIQALASVYFRGADRQQVKPFYQINYDNPIGYLGYLYFLEYMPTHYGQQYAEGFIRCGVPKEALGFLHEHTTVDLTHNQFMENYLEALVHDESDLKAVIYAMQVTGELYAQMIWAAIQRVESGIDYGTISYETKRIRSH